MTEQNEKQHRGAEPIYLAQLRNGSTTWLRFPKDRWDALDPAWDRYVAYTALAQEPQGEAVPIGYINPDDLAKPISTVALRRFRNSLCGISMPVYAAPAAPVAQGLDVDAVMTKIQEFASTWSVVGGRFDDGTALDRAEECKAEIRAILAQAAPSASAQQAVKVWYIADEDGRPFKTTGYSEEAGGWVAAGHHVHCIAAPVPSASPAALTETELRAEFERQHKGRNLKQHNMRGTYISANIAALWNQHKRTAAWMLSRVTPRATGADDPLERFKNPLTPYGMLVRALRVVAGTTLMHMAGHLKLRPSQLSAMETGRAAVTYQDAANAYEYFNSLHVPMTMNALDAALRASKEEKSHG